ncbi:MAG TPA: glycosyltransferase family 4 protein [Phycisphaerae bacterium]|jgi:glycosyltransferase involved in cell wall biosynthesis|nr:glycosyltransferase family 4 protein [Phycisphaerae bacterium]HOL24845.1 glycosyltransferase family 4 protein [Phycisphaerae bacterium]HPU32083.1 glycosyltransferase family 4 protein [Phycisphaerae bacterium]
MRILIIRREPPWPLYYGGRLHSYELCRRLAQRHQVLLVAERPCEEPAAPFNFECRVARAGRLLDAPDDGRGPHPRPDRIDAFFGIDPVFTHELARLAAQWRPDVAVGMGYLSLAHLAGLSDIPKICDLGDDEVLHRLLELRHGRLTRKWHDLKCLLAALLYQRRYLRQVQAVTVLSEADRRFCYAYTRHPRVVCIPHGVDCDHYAPQQTPPDEDRIIFWGSLTFGPNISAILYFAEKVWPQVLRRRPGLRWTIIGRGDSPALQSVRVMPGVDLVGQVEDIRPHAARAAVVVVPMVSGAGIKNKIMEAWAMGKPVLCTPRALGSLPGEHSRNVWLARTPRELATGLLRLLEQPGLREALGTAARQTALRHCSWDRAAQELERLCCELVRPEPAAWSSPLVQADPLLSGRC